MTEIVHNTIKKVKRLVEVFHRRRRMAKFRRVDLKLAKQYEWVEERKATMRDLHQDLRCSIRPRGLESQARLMTSIIMKMNDYNISSTQMLDYIRPIDPKLAERLIEEGF